nr:hypothetical protein [Tanacetum cinerariifolium]
MITSRFFGIAQIDTFYNSLTQSDQDSLNAAARGYLLNYTPRDALTIIENKSKVRTSRNKPVVSKVNTTTSSSSPSSDITALIDIIKELVLMNKANQQASMKAVEETFVTYGGPHLYYECLATDSNSFNAFVTTGAYNQGGNGYHPQGDPNYRVSNQMGPADFLLRLCKTIKIDTIKIKEIIKLRTIKDSINKEGRTSIKETTIIKPQIIKLKSNLQMIS